MQLVRFFVLVGLGLSSACSPDPKDCYEKGDESACNKLCDSGDHGFRPCYEMRGRAVQACVEKGEGCEAACKEWGTTPVTVADADESRKVYIAKLGTEEKVAAMNAKCGGAGAGAAAGGGGGAASGEKPPAVTPEMVFAEQPVWQIEMLPRGLWVRAGSGPVEHSCRQELAMVVARDAVLRTQKKDLVSATTCAPRGAFTVCTLTNPAPDKMAPDKMVHWVFTGPDTAPIMVARLTDAQDDFDAIAPQLAKVEPCPRPSDDPQ